MKIILQEMFSDTRNKYSRFENTFRTRLKNVIFKSVYTYIFYREKVNAFKEKKSEKEKQGVF